MVLDRAFLQADTFMRKESFTKAKMEMPDYEEVEDPLELPRLLDSFRQMLRAAFAHSEHRTVLGGGSPKTPVGFVSDTGKDVLWCQSHSYDEFEYETFGHGTPGDHSVLNIDVQVAISTVQPGRRAGVFLREVSTGRVFLAHRGWLNRGQRHLPLGKVFDRYPKEKVVKASRRGGE
jgi:hypothetical protein